MDHRAVLLPPPPSPPQSLADLLAQLIADVQNNTTAATANNGDTKVQMILFPMMITKIINDKIGDDNV